MLDANSNEFIILRHFNAILGHYTISDKKGAKLGNGCFILDIITNLDKLLLRDTVLTIIIL